VFCRIVTQLYARILALNKVTGVIKKIGNIFRAGLLSLFSTPIYPLQMRHSDIQKCDHELSRVPLAGLLMLDMQAF